MGLKSISVALASAAVVGGGGAYYLHTQKVPDALTNNVNAGASDWRRLSAVDTRVEKIESEVHERLAKSTMVRSHEGAHEVDLVELLSEVVLLEGDAHGLLFDIDKRLKKDLGKSYGVPGMLAQDCEYLQRRLNYKNYDIQSVSQLMNLLPLLQQAVIQEMYSIRGYSTHLGDRMAKGGFVTVDEFARLEDRTKSLEELALKNMPEIRAREASMRDVFLKANERKILLSLHGDQCRERFESYKDIYKQKAPKPR